MITDEMPVRIMRRLSFGAAKTEEVGESLDSDNGKISRCIYYLVSIGKVRVAESFVKEEHKRYELTQVGRIEIGGKLRKSNGSGHVATLSYRAQLAREILAKNDAAKRAIDGKVKGNYYGRKNERS